MAAKKPITEDIELEEEEEQAQERQLNFEDDLVIADQGTQGGYKGPMVRIYLPKLEDPGDAGIKVDQFEHVTIANEIKETRYRVKRGEWVEVPVPVFMVMKEKYPDL